MERIAYLGWEKPAHHHSQFALLAEDFGLSIERPEPGNAEQISDLLREAHAFLVPESAMDHLLGSHLDTLNARVDEGAALLVLLDPNSLEFQNRLLSRFELQGTHQRVRPQQEEAQALGNPYLARIRRSDHTFSDPRVFGGVDEVLIAQPFAIHYAGDANPLLTFERDGYMAIDARTDQLASWQPGELACMAISEGWSEGMALAIAGNVIGDPYRAMAGRFPGIEANPGLAKNILTLLSTGEVRSFLTPHEYMKRIEENLARFVFAVAKGSEGEDYWTEFVPLGIRQKCAGRQEEDKNQFPKRAYLDVTDLIEIIDRKWAVFGPLFEKAELKDSKKLSLEWMRNFNKNYRRMLAHPIRTLVAEFQFKTQDLELLEEYLNKATALLRVVR